MNASSSLASLILCLLLCPSTRGETFVPADGSRAVSIELRSHATVAGAEIRLKQIARWSDADARGFDAADLVIARFAANCTAHTVELEQLKTLLEGAGLNLALVHFRGAARCKVSRTDLRVAAAETPAVAVRPTTRPASRATWIPPEVAMPAHSGSTRTLRELLLADLSERFRLPADAFHVRFSHDDEQLVNLAEPLFRFEIEPRRQSNIGSVSWDVTLRSTAGVQKATLVAQVRAWQTQLVASRFIAPRQVFKDEDVTERRVLVDALPDETPLAREQIVGQQASRDIAAGTVLNGRMIQAVQMVRVGEFMTVLVEQGRFQVKWVAEARESGALGQTIRVRNTATREEFNAIVIGPQQGRLTASAAPAPVAAR